MLQTISVFIFLFIYITIDAVPPEACFAKFRWDDCGRAPKRVLYYWKPGSRCEVGTWRGCLPNLNMFQDEYECVSTCIFTARAQAPDYHAIIETEDENITSISDIVTTSADDNQTTVEVTTVETNTTTAEAGNTDVTETTTVANGTAEEVSNEPSSTDDNATSTNSTSE
ncbi:uncharacterized protein LOC128199886 [Bicyclus anynana]|uniref:Uncharacterized protein LOC128199886 n=1 Tax=Bicyclus anynana TaxID=110368 RepID=A0ABM3M6R1_BICAN|nr:uncharacterized protein LOC128199886 [Bicyclus anynana]